MQITHEEARRLIQLDSDEVLEAPQKRVLDSHLASCPECRNYADGIQRMESILRPLLQRQWAQRAIPLPIETLVSRSDHKLQESVLLATRIAAVGVMFIVFMFSVWQFALPKPSTTGSISASVPPIPVPSTSTQLMSTKMQSGNCEEVTYTVQENDSLASIAAKFTISQKNIMAANNMQSETVVTGTKLMIPVCNFTPTGTVSTLTTTFTPVLHMITSTPGG